jgi:general stress protein YciG
VVRDPPHVRGVAGGQWRAGLTRTEARERGRLGGLATLFRLGREHMQAIGRKGFAATCNKHYGGDRRAMLNELIRRGLASQDPCPWNGFHQHYTAYPEIKETAE